MKLKRDYDAVIVGSGPNGFAAAITLARAGFSVVVLEGHEKIGGGARSAELTLPGFIHDVCSAVHPLGIASPFFRSVPLDRYGLRWIQPPVPLAHPLDDGTAALLARSTEATGETLGPDSAAYGRLMNPLLRSWDDLTMELLEPLHFPRHPLTLGRFGWNAIKSGRGLAEDCFKGAPARALFGGLSAHAVLPLERPATAAFGLLLGLLGHAVGWPVAEGGSQKLSDALAAYFRSLGGEIRTGSFVASLDELPPSRVVLLDVTPAQLDAIAGAALPPAYRRRLRQFRYGAGVFKVDWALGGPIPWTAPGCASAATVHVGGTLDQIAAAEAAVGQGRIPERPFTLVVQPSLFDPSRAPAGRHTAWAYCHVPNGSAVDMREAIEAQVERFAPGFRDLILARSALFPKQLEDYNPNCLGGDISGGSNELSQLFARPLLRRVPYATDMEGVYLCSASTPPGGGVHGMCGYNAARAAMRRELR